MQIYASPPHHAQLHLCTSMHQADWTAEPLYQITREGLIFILRLKIETQTSSRFLA